MTKHVAVIPGDLAGQEVVPEAVRVVDALGLGYEFEEFEVGAAPVLRGEPAMSEQTFQEASRADAILFGAIGDPRVPTRCVRWSGYPASGIGWSMTLGAARPSSLRPSLASPATTVRRTGTSGLAEVVGRPELSRRTTSPISNWCSTCRRNVEIGRDASSNARGPASR